MTTARDDRWYAVRTKPGSQRMAKVLEAANDEFDTEAKKAERERRRGESIIERNLRNEGVDVYMPSFWYETKHHRTNKLIERRLPLLVGYAFVHLPDFEFEKVRGVDGVMCFLQTNRDSGPLRFSEDDLSPLLFAEWQVREQRRFERAQRQETARFNRRNKLHGELKRFLPKGRGVRINLREQAEKTIHSMPDVVKARVLGIIKELDALDSDDGIDLIAKVA